MRTRTIILSGGKVDDVYRYLKSNQVPTWHESRLLSSSIVEMAAELDSHDTYCFYHLKDSSLVVEEVVEKEGSYLELTFVARNLKQIREAKSELERKTGVKMGVLK